MTYATSLPPPTVSGDRTSLRSRRGMTVFVVLLVIGMLFAVGTFAAKVSALGVSNAGRYRQMGQTHHVAEMGLTHALAELGRDPGVYKRELERTDTVVAPTRSCKLTPDYTALGISQSARPNCMRLGYDAFEALTARATGGVPVPLLENRGETPEGFGVPGSLGPGNARGNFGVEIDDVRQYAPPAGFAATPGPSQHLNFYRVTVMSTGQILPYTKPDGTPVTITDDEFKYNVSQEEVRAHVVIGPI